MLYPWWVGPANLTKHLLIARFYNLVAFGHKELWQPLAAIHIGSTKSVCSVASFGVSIEFPDPGAVLGPISRTGGTGKAILDIREFARRAILDSWTSPTTPRAAPQSTPGQQRQPNFSVTILPVFGGKCDSESPQATMAAFGREYVSL